MRIGYAIFSLFYSVILLGNSPPRILSHDGNETAYVSVLENYPYVTKINYTEASLPATLTGEAHGEYRKQSKSLHEPVLRSLISKGLATLGKDELIRVAA